MTSPSSVSQESQEWEIPSVPAWSYWLLFGGLLAVGIGRSVTLAVLAPIGRELGLLEIQIGAISTCTAIMFFFGGPFWGRRSEKMGRRPVMVIGFLGYAATTVAFAQVVEWGLSGTVTLLLIYPLMILTRVAFAALSSGVFPAAQAFVATTTKAEDRTSGVALNAAAFGLGSILGPALGGVLVFISLLAPLYVAALLALICALMIWWLLPEPPRRPMPKGGKPLRFFDPRIRPQLLIGFCAAYTMATVHQVGGFYFQDVLGTTAAQTAQRIGMALAAMAIVSMGIQFLIIRPFKLRPKTLLRWGGPLTCAGGTVLLFAGSLWGLILGMVLAGMGLGMTMPGNSAAASLSVAPHEQGSLAGITMAANSLGFALGPILGTALYQIMPQIPYIVSLLISLGIAIYVFILPIPDPRDYKA